MKPTNEQLANRAAWLAALRSGNYSQGSGLLRSNAGYCCLGVDAEAAGLSYDDYLGFKFFIDDVPILATTAPPDDWFSARHGLDESKKGMITDLTAEFVHYCIDANDNWHWTFNEIADGLEWMFVCADCNEENRNETP